MPKRDAKQEVRKFNLEQVQRYRRLFGTDDGKWILEDLRREFAQRTSFDPTNPHATAFLEGQRHVVLAIEARLEFNTKPLIAAILEHEQGDGI